MGTPMSMPIEAYSANSILHVYMTITFPSPLCEQSFACRRGILVTLPSVAPAASHERDQHNQDACVDDRYHERPNLRLLLRRLSTSRTVSGSWDRFGLALAKVYPMADVAAAELSTSLYSSMDRSKPSSGFTPTFLIQAFQRPDWSQGRPV